MNKLKKIARIDRHLEWISRHNHPELEAIANTLTEYRESLLLTTPPAVAPPTAEDIVIDVVTEYHGIGYRELIGKRRVQHIMTGRHQAAWLLRKYTELSLEAIGKLLGERLHCTIMHSLKVVTDMLEIGDAVYRQDIAILSHHVERKTSALKDNIETFSITEKQAS